MSEDADFEPPRAVQTWAPAWERLIWTAILLSCTAPFQAWLDVNGRPGTTLLTGGAAATALALTATRARPGSVFTLAMAAWPFLLVVALMGAFTLGAVDPRWSQVRWVTWLPCVAAAFCAATRLGAAQFVEAVLAALAAGMALSVGAAVLAPAYGAAGGAWSGIYPTKNALGHVAGVALALLVGFGRPTVSWAVILIGVGCSAACLAMAGSASGVAIAVLLLAVIFGILGARGALRLAGIAVMAVAGSVFVLGGGALMGWLTGLLGRDASLSGRTAIWNAAEPFVMQQPVIGSGYDYTGSPEFAARLRELFGVYSVHSGYLDALITLGFGLSALLGVAVTWALVRAWRRPVWDVQRRAVATALLAGGLLSAVTEAGVTHPSGPMQMLWLLAVFGLYAAA